MPQGALFDLEFKGLGEIRTLLFGLPALLERNLRSAVAETVLFGITRIAMDTPVDTGLLRASIGGQVRNTGSGPGAAEGRRMSLTQINGLEGVIGTIVHYAIYQEFGFTATGPKHLTRKQLRFLFAVGILKRGPGKRPIPGNAPRQIPKLKNGKRPKYRLQTHAPLPGSVPEPKARATSFGVNRAINRRANIATHVKGRGFFRRNTPAIRAYFYSACERAVSLALQGKEMAAPGA